MKIAFVFPGQGSQSVGMMKGFDDHPVVRDTFDEASSVLGRGPVGAGRRRAREEALDLTVNTQPVMLTAAVAVWRAWRAAGGARPAVVAGHSLGEYSALVAAGALAFRDAVPLVRFRAQAMQEAVPPGDGRHGRDPRRATTTRSPRRAARPPQGAVRRAGQLQRARAGRHRRRARGGRARDASPPRSAAPSAAVLLPVSAPFHSSLLKPAAERLAQRLAQVAVRCARDSRRAQRRRRACIAHAGRDPRRARAAGGESGALDADDPGASRPPGVTHVVECGPGKVLAGLVKRIDDGSKRSR